MQSLNINSLRKPSTFPDLTFSEYVDLDRISQLFQSDHVQQVKFEGCVYENEKHQLETYAISVNNKFSTVKYEYGKTLDCGRVYPLQMLSHGALRREIRHTICKDYYIDIDIENAHPQIMYQVMKQHDYHLTALEHYCMDRENYLKVVQEFYQCSRTTAKNLFIRLLYSGTFEGWVHDNKIKNTNRLSQIEAFTNDMATISKIITENNRDIETIHDKPKTIVSYFCQEIERQILEIMFLHLKKLNLIDKTINCVLCFDGIMINKKTFNDSKQTINSVLCELSDVIKTIFGFNLLFTAKDFENFYNLDEYHPLPCDFLFPKKFNLNDMTDHDCADLFLTVYNIENLQYDFNRDIMYIYYHQENQRREDSRGLFPKAMISDCFRLISPLIENERKNQNNLTSKKDELMNDQQKLKFDSKFTENQLDRDLLTQRKKELDAEIHQIDKLQEKCKQQLKKYKQLRDRFCYNVPVINISAKIKARIFKFEMSMKFDVGDEQLDNIHFKNGCYELSTNTFRPRRRTDYITKTLDYNYYPVYNHEKINFIQTFF
jgi:hypothetical protein